MVSVVIPAFRCKKHILDVISKIGDEVSLIYVVDDACPEQTGKYTESNVHDKRIRIIFHEKNQGVGGAVISGYQQAMKDGSKVIVKVDGDGQMDPALIARFIKPILEGEADYTKGNRFNQIEFLTGMPPLRIFGNAGLSFLTKLSSGYWNLFDPTNGYTAIHASVLGQMNLEKLSRRYFFESDMLFRLNICRAVVVDIPMQAKYGEEISGLKEFSVILLFLKGHLKNLFKRITYNYFLRDFNFATLELLLGFCLLSFGVIYGGISWYGSYENQSQTPSGVVMLAALPVILGIQMLLGFLNYDMANVPSAALHKKI